jgi:hypothetical protein
MYRLLCHLVVQQEETQQEGMQKYNQLYLPLLIYRRYKYLLGRRHNCQSWMRFQRQLLQPVIFGGGAELPDIPLPDPPDALPLPAQSFQDSPVQQIIDLPVPTAPEMPPLPPVPTSSGQTNGVHVPIPLMPGLVSLPFSSLPSAESFMIWSTPEIPESINIDMVMPATEKGLKGRGKSKQKVKSQSLKN